MCLDMKMPTVLSWHRKQHPVIALMPDQEDVEDLGGTLRLGSYPCVLAEGSRSYELLERKRFRNVTDIVMR